MDELGDWAWGAMGLAFLYEHISLISDSYVASCGGYITLDEFLRTSGISFPGFVMMSTTLLLPRFSHVIWRLYERRRDIMPFQDICWYSGWIMAAKDRRVCHLPERVLRQYGYV
ncbi:hypothetical protein MtrunA17_Chr7g0230131 [Medicago truncatula]|uniref:Transmembrane protein n=1 Tax=Medicago truncatula TaxID=3880 RepID=A0A396GW74_MEDTR|nr:hypothetical protein MtrunA17_Chr7g0230131 [Medicago truncatula]